MKTPLEEETHPLPSSDKTQQKQQKPKDRRIIFKSLKKRNRQSNILYLE